MIPALRNTVPVLLLLGTLGAAVSSYACGSSPPADDATPADNGASTEALQLTGLYGTTDPGEIAWLSFQKTEYFLGKSGVECTSSPKLPATCSSSGTFELTDDNQMLVLTDGATSEVRRLRIDHLTTKPSNSLSGSSVQPLTAGSLVGGSGSLLSTGAPAKVVDGMSVEGQVMKASSGQLFDCGGGVTIVGPSVGLIRPPGAQSYGYSGRGFDEILNNGKTCVGTGIGA